MLFRSVADSPYGPWKRLDEPILKTQPGTFYSFLTSNPSPIIQEDGSVLMIFKGRHYLEKTCLNDGVSHRYGAWVTTTAATVFSPETQVTTCEFCGKKQYRQAGSALAPTMQVNTEKITLKTKHFLELIILKKAVL